MKKTFITMAATAILGLATIACGSSKETEIKAVNPEPVPLTKAHLGEMALEVTAIPNVLKICGKEIKDVKTSLRNGFDYISGNGTVAPVVAPEQATATLVFHKLDTACVGSSFVNGHVITFNFEYTWKFKDGSELKQTASVIGASQASLKDAISNGIQDMYNFAFSSYLTKLNLAENVK